MKYIFGTVLVLAFFGHGAATASDARQRFLADAPPAWARIVEAGRHVVGTMTVTRSWTDSKGKGGSREVDTFKVSGNNALYTSERKGATEVYAVNSEYGFSLRRNSPKAAWAITRFTLDRKSIRRITDGDAVVFANYVLYLYNRFLPDWIKEPTFVIDEADEAAGGIVIVTFHYSPAGPHRPNTQYAVRGEISFDPARSWVPVKFKYDAEIADAVNQGTETSTRQFRTVNGLPVPAKFVSEGNWEYNDPGPYHHEYIFPRFEYREVPESDFELSAFGVDEPGAGGGRFFWFFASSALIFIALGVWFRILYRRRHSR